MADAALDPRRRQVDALAGPMVIAPHSPESAASFPRRLAAAAVDALVLATVALALHLGRREAFGAPDGARPWYLELALTVSLPSVVYFALSDASARGATLGKRLFGLRVVHVYGTRIAVGRALVRTAFKLVPWEVAHYALCFPSPWFASGELSRPRLLMAMYAIAAVYLAAALLTLKKQSVHDLAVGTWVVRVARANVAA